MLCNGGKEYNERLANYKNKTEKKYKIYKELENIGYKHLYIYREDINYNFNGLINKLKENNLIKQ